jgi:hypothetical protein
MDGCGPASRSTPICSTRRRADRNPHQARDGRLGVARACCATQADRRARSATPPAGRCVELIEGGEPVALMDVILTEVLQGLRSDREAQLVERHLRAFPSFASKASTTSSLPPTSTGPRGTRESRSARRSTASSPLRASGRTPRCCTPTTTSTASPPAPRCGSGNPSSEPDPSPRAQKARGCGPSVGDTGLERPANRRLLRRGMHRGLHRASEQP